MHLPDQVHSASSNQQLLLAACHNDAMSAGVSAGPHVPSCSGGAPDLEEEEEEGHLQCGDSSDDENKLLQEGDGTRSCQYGSEALGPDTQPQAPKRRHVQSQRMQEYQQQLRKGPFRKERVCPQCNRTLYSGPGFRYHLQRHRRDNESFPCKSCRKVFTSFNGLKYHLKRKRCRGQCHSVSTNTVSIGAQGDSRNVCEDGNGRLMELANIATGPQSPLLLGARPPSQGRTQAAFFDESETSAALTLSSMKQQSFGSSEGPSGNKKTDKHSQPTPHTRTDKLLQSDKSKRPMNGFMLFAQRNRTEFNKKYPDMNNRMISTKLSEEWKRLPPAERKTWVEEADAKAKQHEREHPDCWKRKK